MIVDTQLLWAYVHIVLFVYWIGAVAFLGKVKPF